MNMNLNQNEINEASLLIAIESFVLTSLDTTRQPRSFYETFTNLLLDFDQVYNPDFSYTCLIDLFCSLLHDYDLRYETSSSLCNRLKRRTFKDWQAYFNRARADHLNELRQHRYNERLNAAKLDKRLEGILKSYSAVLVVRVDLAYVVSPDIEQVDNDLEMLRRKIKRSEYGKDVLLLIWALEQGEKKGYHCHIALIFNERKRTSAWSIAKAVGELWEDVTEDDGSYFNCHNRRYLKQYEEQDTLGIGIIYSEVDYQVRRMRSTLSYLARPEKEQYLRVKTTRKMRTFGMSQR
ncbi:TPA: inovirus-type Gp2 protein [Acinetobacter baumannii]|uniref:Inovirus-type Gp2 protein n=2 Tax=Acinetobacter baumannii TaxID=470 RepID=A0A6L8M6A3_ACIBA|nr:inovirus-type Gp2 protein [Acinetobacter baumannii]MCJ8817094.1 inovirus Gp2 family protein [Acinetobacter baumannii]MCJ8987809.1 inovirus Gp2 family protein [Acinetobacter baumannii]MCJ8990680.1 inovirus Gp2 family protein [Acinetobacter baumannii]MDP7924177.1 inovirus-type Gp2 protein [Acinetobacter baumannii]MYM77462.1 inovirus-type Gp2 protein [Acinetobacter baumannii]